MKIVNWSLRAAQACFWFDEGKHKIPHPYSAAEESAASLTGIRDDVYFKCQVSDVAAS
jgi:hypothetical protein